MAEAQRLEDAPELGPYPQGAKYLNLAGIVIFLAGFFSATSDVLADPEMNIKSVSGMYAGAMGLGAGLTLIGVVWGTVFRSQQR